MSKETQIIYLYGWINDCWKLALNYDSNGVIKEELSLPDLIITNWEKDGWIEAYNNIDKVVKNVNKLAKAKPEYIDSCKMMKIKAEMLKYGVENILEKQFGIKLYCRNGELII